MKTLCLASIFILPFVACSQSEKANGTKTAYDYPYIGIELCPRFEIFKTSDIPEKNLNECYYNGILLKKSDIVTILQKLKTETDYKLQRFVFLYDPAENKKKLNVFLKEIESLGYSKPTLIPIKNLREKFVRFHQKRKKDVEPADPYAGIHEKILIDWNKLIDKRLKLNLKNDKEYAQAVKLYQDFLEKYKNQKDHYIYKSTRSYYNALLRKEVYGKNAFDYPAEFKAPKKRENAK